MADQGKDLTNRETGLGGGEAVGEEKVGCSEVNKKRKEEAFAVCNIYIHRQVTRKFWCLITSTL